MPYFFLKLKKENTTYYGIVNIPNNRVSRLYKVQCLSGYNLTLIDEIIRMNLVYLFQGYFVEEVVSFRVIRNELFDIQDEYSGVLKDKIKEKLQDANKKNPTSVIYDEKISDESLLFLKNYFRFKEKDLLPGSRYHDLKDLSQLKNPFGEKLELQKPAKLTYEPFNKYECIFKKIKQQDHLLYFPYHSYDHVLRFFNESSVDAQVSEIRVTLYRLATNSAIISALINAAKNGKKVLVFIEIKAREDEAHNIYWAEEMEKAGVTVVYSIPELKVHAKMALIYRNEPEGIKHYSFLCTGNFNEQTANFYTDFGFFTSKRKINDGIVKVFENIYRKIPLSDMGDLLVTKYNFKRKFKKLINNEIINKIQGKPAKIILKLNNLEESEMIDMLYDAANAGVEVILIIRSICCFNIGHPKSENLKLIRLVDIHLEHARVVYFHNNGKEIIYLSSADWMQRNIYNRVEIAFPLKSKKAKKLVKSVLDLQIADNQKAVTVDHALNNLKIKPTNGKLIRAQYATYDLLNQFLH